MIFVGLTDLPVGFGFARLHDQSTDAFLILSLQ